MNPEERTIRNWMKRCLKSKCTPIALVTVSPDGYPHVLTEHDSETLKQVWKHLAEAPVIDSSTHFEDQEN